MLSWVGAKVGDKGSKPGPDEVRVRFTCVSAGEGAPIALLPRAHEAEFHCRA